MNPNDRDTQPADAPIEPSAPEAAAPAPSAEEVAELKDRVLRTLAEMENLRRRTARDVEDARKFANTSFARDLLEVADNLGRALASVPAEARTQTEFMKNLVLGVEMTERSLQSAFEKHQVRRVEPQRGERFDHNLHQAMFEVPTSELPAGTVAEVIQAGYVVADRLLRPALVGVAKAAATGEGREPPSARAKVDTRA
ncbi:MAG: nucleotide exchange factor GrpE [Geminicoccaceae bacterium]